MSDLNAWTHTWSRSRPTAEALVDVGTGGRWTWAQLHEAVLGWTARLQAEGVQPGDRVALIALNRAETLMVLLAVRELGAILVPLNWRLAPAELSWQLEHSGARLVLVDRVHQHLEVGAHPTLLLDEGPGEDTLLADVPGSQRGAPWMLMYTSGSTGRPKAAVLTHGQVAHNATITRSACGLDETSSTLTFAPLFHTGGMNCLSTPLLAVGGRVVLVPRLDVGEALSLIASEGITHLMGVPTIYQLLAQHPGFSEQGLASVRDAICGGAALPASLLRRYLGLGIPLRQGFGLTEVGPNCFSMPPDRIQDKMVDAAPRDGVNPEACVGRPIAPIEAKVVRADGTQCVADEAGELLLRGPVVCAGYWQDPAATAAAIVEGWFHTGDLLSCDAEGFFSVRGRLKDMYISGGENVYPPEVESVLLQHPAVAQAAVIGVPDPRWGEVGHAFLEAAPGSHLDEAELRAFLEPRLASFKRPKALHVLDRLPRTGSDKIDKPALKATLSPAP